MPKPYMFLPNITYEEVLDFQKLKWFDVLGVSLGQIIWFSLKVGLVLLIGFAVMFSYMENLIPMLAIEVCPLFIN